VAPLAEDLRQAPADSPPPAGAPTVASPAAARPGPPENGEPTDRTGPAPDGPADAYAVGSADVFHAGDLRQPPAGERPAGERPAGERPAGDRPSAPAEPAGWWLREQDDNSRPDLQANSPYRGAAAPADARGLDDTRPAADPVTERFEPVAEPDEEPPGEPVPQRISPADAVRVSRMSADVLVVDGRPRYHAADCPHLAGRPAEALPVAEAVDLGFTPCGACRPVDRLVAEAAARR
jgi:clumping factor A